MPGCLVYDYKDYEKAFRPTSILLKAMEEMERESYLLTRSLHPLEFTHQSGKSSVTVLHIAYC